MSTNPINQVPYLKTTRNFPKEIDKLLIELDKAHVDTANAVNNRTISLFPTTRPAVNGESWFISQNKRQQGLRQVYAFTSTANIAHGINLINVDYFVRNFGEFTDGTNWYGLIHGSNVAIAGQRSFYVTPKEIVFLAAGVPPALTKGTIVLEWISRP